MEDCKNGLVVFPSSSTSSVSVSEREITSLIVEDTSFGEPCLFPSLSSFGEPCFFSSLVSFGELLGLFSSLDSSGELGIFSSGNSSGD